jgi:hypothetical protein
MSSHILDYEPVLSYIGSIDIYNSAQGNTMYSIMYNSDITTLGNVLMFEYKLISTGATVVPDNIKTGFVSLENATNTGIDNQWSIAISALNDEYNPTPPKTIQVRVYVGITSLTSPSVGITKWSNTLEVHNPPIQPTIYSAYYNTDSYAQSFDDLYIILDEDAAINYSEVKFVVAYYYKDASNTTVWDVSGLLETSDVIGSVSKRLITVSDFGTVSDTAQTVYVSVYAVYPFIVVDETFYAVSEVSLVADAVLATIDDAPIVTDIVYDIYNGTTSKQVMDVKWDPPPIIDIPTYVVERYILGKSTDNINWTIVDPNIPGTHSAYPVDVAGDECGTTVYFRVTAIYTNGTESSPSLTNDNSHLNIFKYAKIPPDVDVLWASASSDYMTMSLNMTFKNPNFIDLGCGEPVDYTVNVYNANNVIIATQTIPYVELTAIYQVSFSDIQNTSGEILTIGTVGVNLNTIDTNSQNIMVGAISSDTWIASRPPSFENVTMAPDRSTLSFSVISPTPLASECNALTVISNEIMAIPWNTTSPYTPGVMVTQSTGSKNENIYEVVMIASTFIGSQTFPQPFGVGASNNIGISILSTILPQSN